MSLDAPDIPQPRTVLIGREREIATVCSLLRRDDVPVVTLTGPGGVGKTRLALRVAEEMRSTFADGVVFVPLEAIRDPELVASAIAMVLGVREVGDRTLDERLKEYVHDKHMLLILDNFEQVLPAASLIGELVTAAPGLSVLVTSRAVLRVYGEHDVKVPPLSLPDSRAEIMQSDAVRLFAERASAVSSRFHLTETNAPVVAAICHRLDGLPLAIELAAARISLLPPAAILERLESRLPLLTGGARNHPTRLQTMREAIAWSYDLLSPEEQVLFRQLGVFVGGFSLPAAEFIIRAIGDRSREQVPEPSQSIIDSIGALVDQSLLRATEGANGEPRFAMLETIREFALDQLSVSGELSAARETHARYFLSYAEEADVGFMSAGVKVATLDRLELDLPNFRSALNWAETMSDSEIGLRLAPALYDLWGLRNLRTEGSEWISRALARDKGPPSVTRARALACLGKIVQSPAAPEQGESLLHQALKMSTSLGELGIATRIANELTTFAIDAGNNEQAETLIAQAEVLCEQAGDRASRSLLAMGRGFLAHRRGDLNDAQVHFTEALTISQQASDLYVAAIALELLGYTQTDRGDYTQAATHFRDSLATWQALGPIEGLTDWIAMVALLASRVDEPVRAVRWFAVMEAQVEVLGFDFPLPEQARFRQTAAHLRQLLGEAEFVAALEAARHLSPVAATSEADAWLVELATRVTAIKDTDPGIRSGLTRRELEVLRLVAAGRTNREIAEVLFISTHTVKRHMTTILSKLDLPSRSSAASYARDNKLS